jgi:flagellar hook-associated protein 3 FlgL
VLSVRTALGARLRELDALGAQAADETLLHQQELSRLVDLDYAEGASRLAQQQLTTQAAQQSYLRLTSLSLFNFL